MNNQNDVIRIEKLIDEKYIKKDFFITLSFLALFLLIGLCEKNLFFPNNGLGLLQHGNIWIFLSMNMLTPIIINGFYMTLKDNINLITFEKFKEKYKDISKYKSTTLSQQFLEYCWV